MFRPADTVRRACSCNDGGGPLLAASGLPRSRPSTLSPRLSEAAAAATPDDRPAQLGCKRVHERAAELREVAPRLRRPSRGCRGPERERRCGVLVHALSAFGRDDAESVERLRLRDPT